MTNEHRSVEDYLDDMALKIMMIEPGDLSVVGELLELVERLLGDEALAEFPQLAGMSKAFWRVLERIIMGEAADSGENFDRLGQCLVQMQEIARREEEAGDQPLVNFCEYMTAIGYRIAPRDILAGESETVEEEGAAPPAAESCPAGGKEGVTASTASVVDFLQDQELLSGFIAESSEHLESIEVNILELEKNPENKEIINNIFRTFHTIKGVSGFLNLRTINELAHSIENLLDDVRNGRMSMNSEVIDVVLSVGDFMRSMIRNIKDILERGPEQYIEFNIVEHVERIRSIQQQRVDDHPPEGPRHEVARQEAAELVVEVKELEIKLTDGESSHREESKEPPLLNGASRPEEKAMPVRNRVAESIKVDIEKLDSLVNAVGELVIMQSLVRQNPLVARIGDPKLTRDFSQLSRITTEVQRTAMSMRMVPIRQTFKKMIRLVRDLSRKSGKKVELIMEGEETEIDRNMVDSIYDPLVHMIRNSIDHGVQLPAERMELGKPPIGTVHLRAYQKGGNIIIEIEDDGQGLNTEKIRRKALDRGFLEPDSSALDEEINSLIFLPGFSTADRITNVSGRGVGMDVVKKSVERLRGTVEVQSQPGKGALFLLRLPLTLAIIDGIVVRVGSERYIIPTISIQESLRPKPSNYSTIHGKSENVLIRDKLIPIIRLYEQFGVVPSCSDPLQAIMVVVENEGRKRALMVDELLGKQEVVIKSLGSFLHKTKGIAGGTILGDGRVGLILDLAGLIGMAGGASTRGAARDETGPLATEFA